MRPFLAGLMLLAAAAETGAAQIEKFPYEAVVDADSAFVHSGPGKRYYPTSRLSRGEHVVVHRHDPGGWYMIAPPPGSFSWIRADAVRRAGSRRGVLTANDVVVRVGSALEDSRDVFQSRLSTGVRVEILGEQTIRTERGPVRMLKIVPPEGEWRWVRGRTVIPVDRAVRRRHDADPYNVPTHARRHGDEAPAPHPNLNRDYDGPARHHHAHDHHAHNRDNHPRRRRERSADRRGTRRSGPLLQSLNRDRSRLRELDEEFRAIIELDTSEWEFAELRDDYLNLRETVSHPAVASQIRLRLASIDKYAGIKDEYDSFNHMTAKISRRDARLQALQEEHLHAIESGSTAQPVSHSTHPTHVGAVVHPHAIEPVPEHDFPPSVDFHYASPQNPPLPNDAVADSQWQVIRQRGTSPQLVQPHEQYRRHPAEHHPLHAAPASSVQGSFSTQVLPPNASPQPAPTGAARQGTPLKGAGIVQRAVSPDPRAPKHVLLDTNGRILAYLQGGPGVDLDQHVGQSMGIRGQRLQRPDLKMSLFQVESLTPVNLQ